MRYLILTLMVALLIGCSAPEKKGDKAEAHYMLGVSFLRVNDMTPALREFLLAEELDPDDAKTQAALGQTYHAKKAYAEAEVHYLKALKLDKGNPNYENNLAALYLDMQQWDDAITYFEKAARNLIFPQPEVAWTGHGYALFKKGDYMKAIESYMKAIDHNWRYPQAYARRGEALSALGKPDKAVADFQEALKIAPNYALAHYDLAIAYMKLRKAEEAISHFEQVIELVPESEMARQAKSYLLVLK